VGDSRKQVKRFLPEVRKSIGVALDDAQKGDKALAGKPLHAFQASVEDGEGIMTRKKVPNTKSAAETCSPTLSLTTPTSF